MLLAEHANPDIACFSIKILGEVCEDRELETSDLFIKICDQNEFIRTIAVLVGS